MMQDSPCTEPYARGSHRVVPPEETLRRIAPLLGEAGITRCADVTGLDCLGIPGFCAIRPRGVALQVSNGKGLRPVDAKVSALMEGLELHHAEQPIGLRTGSAERLRREDLDVVAAPELPSYDGARYFGERFVLDWAPAEEMVSGRRCWVPAGSVYLCWPSPVAFSSNGLASGNTVAEATLHALYEILERDAVSRVFVDGRLRLDERCTVVDLDTIDAPAVVDLRARIEAAGLMLRLLHVRGAVPVHTCWAMIVDPSPFASASAIQGGYGTHLSPTVAATRAITEAAQARLALIHGTREDIDARMYRWTRAHARVRAFFHRLRGSFSFRSLEDHSGQSADGDLARLMTDLVREGFDRVYRTDLARAPFHIPVVKVQVPGLRMKEGLF